MYIVVLMIGIVLGMVLYSMLSINKLNEEIKERNNAEQRGQGYARKMKKIEDIVFLKGQGSIVDRFDKIKEVINSDETNK